MLRFFWILDNMVCGYSDRSIPQSNWPKGLTLVPYQGEDSVSISDIYWDSEAAEIKRKPPYPEEGEYFWDWETLNWQEIHASR